jgi:hypothetical protein
MEIKHILLDQDGVLCNWVGGVCKLYGRDYDQLASDWVPGESCLRRWLGVSNDELWERVNAEGAQFWADLEPYPWAYGLWVRCNAYAPTTICTTPGFHPSSAEGKLMWFDRHFAPCTGPARSFREYILTPHKGVVAGPGKLLIDDREFVCDEFREGGGAAILFPNPLNSRSAQASEADQAVLADLSHWVKHGKAPTK